MKQKLHPAVVGVAIALTLALLFVFYLRTADSDGNYSRQPPPAVMKAYQEKGKALFPTTIPGKYGGTLGVSVQNAKPTGH